MENRFAPVEGGYGDDVPSGDAGVGQSTGEGVDALHELAAGLTPGSGDGYRSVAPDGLEAAETETDVASRVGVHWRSSHCGRILPSASGRDMNALEISNAIYLDSMDKQYVIRKSTWNLIKNVFKTPKNNIRFLWMLM